MACASAAAAMKVETSMTFSTLWVTSASRSMAASTWSVHVTPVESSR